jgi:polyhydroxybutyrate depolymerase
VLTIPTHSTGIVVGMSRRRGVLVAVLVVALVGTGGCGRLRSRSGDGTAPVATDPAGGPAAGTFPRTLTVDGRQRTYRVHVPASVAGRTGLPVVVVLHGGGGSGEIIERQTHLSAVADRAGFVAVYPDGTAAVSDRILLTWNAGTCCGYARDHGVDDVKFIGALLDALAGQFHTDPARVYVTGFSNGAMMAYRLACELSGRITAIAPVSGALNVDDCRPARPLPVLILHGTADRNVPYDGGPPVDPPFPGAGSWTNRSQPETVAFWTRYDGCASTPTESRDGAVVRATYAPCAPGLDVTVYRIEGGGHAWPGGTKGRNAADEPASRPDASAVIWDFFAQHGPS